MYVAGSAVILVLSCTDLITDPDHKFDPRVLVEFRHLGHFCGPPRRKKIIICYKTIFFLEILGPGLGLVESPT